MHLKLTKISGSLFIFSQFLCFNSELHEKTKHRTLCINLDQNLKNETL